VVEAREDAETGQVSKELKLIRALLYRAPFFYYYPNPQKPEPKTFFSRKDAKKGRIVSLKKGYPEALWVMFFLCALCGFA